MITKTEMFARECATEYLGETATNEEEYGAPNWAGLIELIMQIVTTITEDCPKRNALASTAQRGPSRWQRVRTRRVAYQTAQATGYPTSESANVADAIIARASNKEEPELQAVVDEIGDQDNWLF